VEIVSASLYDSTQGTGYCTLDDELVDPNRQVLVLLHGLPHLDMADEFQHACNNSSMPYPRQVWTMPRGS
jgi:hypothetical protein